MPLKCIRRLFWMIREQYFLVDELTRKIFRQGHFSTSLLKNKHSGNSVNTLTLLYRCITELPTCILWQWISWWRHYSSFEFTEWEAEWSWPTTLHLCPQVYVGVLWFCILSVFWLIDANLQNLICGLDMLKAAPNAIPTKMWWRGPETDCSHFWHGKQIVDLVSSIVQRTGVRGA